MAIFKYSLVRPQGVWPACVRHHFFANEKLPDFLIDLGAIDSTASSHPRRASTWFQWNCSVDDRILSSIPPYDYRLGQAALFISYRELWLVIATRTDMTLVSCGAQCIDARANGFEWFVGGLSGIRVTAFSSSVHVINGAAYTHG